MKLFGFTMIVASSLVFGFSYTSAKKERLNDLKSFVYMLEIMMAELSTSLYSVPELIERIEVKLEGKALSFIKLLKINLGTLGEKSFSIIWKECLGICSLSLFSAEIESITAIGDILGRYSLDIQKQAIEGSLILLRENEKKAAQEFPQLKRLSLGLSVSAGMLLGIFLI